MNHTQNTIGTPFLKIKEACAATGLSMYYLRKGCREGTVPHIKSGPVYYIHIEKLLKQMEESK